MGRVKLNPVLKGRCPVCHFEEFHLVSCQLGQSEAENARLQERVEGLEANRRTAFSLIVSYSDEADEARTLAERRRAILKAAYDLINHREHAFGGPTVPLATYLYQLHNWLDWALPAIDALPEEARREE